MHHVRHVSILIGTLLAGCSTVAAPTHKLEPPSARLMQAPEPLPEVRESDDLYEAHARLRASYARTAGQATGLQKYVRVIQKKQKGAP